MKTQSNRLTFSQQFFIATMLFGLFFGRLSRHRVFRQDSDAMKSVRTAYSRRKQAARCEWLVPSVSSRQFVEFGLGEPVGPARFRGYGGESGEQCFELFEP